VDDRCPDVLAGQRQGLVRLAAQLGVERGVVQRVGEFGKQVGLRQDGLEDVFLEVRIALGSGGL
jgi:hypothetical protein